MDERPPQNDLIRAQEDESGFDLLNEETFGDLGTYDEDWENEHELFAEADTKSKVTLQSSEHSPDLDEDNFFERSFQNDVENQLTRLVLDDDDILSNCYDYERPYDMWADSLNLDFIKPAHNAINGFKNSDRLNHKNGSPMREDLQRNGQIINSKGAMTVEELEKMLLTYGTPSPNQSSTHATYFTAPQPCLVPALGQQSDSIKPYCQPNARIQHNEGAINSRLTLLPPKPPVILPQHLYSQQKHQFCMPPGYNFHPSMLPPQQLLNPQFHPSSPQQPGHFYPHQPIIMPKHQGMLQQHQMMLHQHILRQQLLANQHQLPHEHHHQHHLPQDHQQNLFHPDTKQQFPLCQQQLFQQKQMMMMSQKTRAFNSQIFPHPPYWASPAGYGWQPCPVPSSKEDIEKREMREYDGLMEQREKDWIIKIQLMQLHTDNPYVDDYYFTCWSMKKLIRESLRKKRELKKEGDGDFSEDEDYDAPALLIPQLAKADNKRYTPVQYEGSLGKLTSSSIHNPRQIIDFQLSSNSEDAKKQDSRKIKELFSKIEKSYDILLEADDIEKKALALPIENRSQYYDQRKELISKLCKSLLTEDSTFLHQVLTIRKGVVLIIRLLPLINEAKLADQVVCKILEKLIGLLKREWRDEVSANLFKSLSKIIMESHSPVLFFEALCLNFKNEGDHMHQVIHSQLGFSLLLLMINIMEAHFTSIDKDEWCPFIKSVTKCLATHRNVTFPRPFKIKSISNKQLAEDFSRGLRRLVVLQPITDEDKNVMTKAIEVLENLLNVI